jgi:DNA-binding transcriptional ArsR family regulator
MNSYSSFSCSIITHEQAFRYFEVKLDKFETMEEKPLEEQTAALGRFHFASLFEKAIMSSSMYPPATPHSASVTSNTEGQSGGSQHPLDGNQVQELRQHVLSVEKAQRMAEFLSTLGDANRWRILSALAVQELRVRDLAEVVDMTESAVSHQLRTLRVMRLVSYRKRGRNVFYCLKDSHIFNLYREVSEHLDEPDDEEVNPDDQD